MIKVTSVLAALLLAAPAHLAPSKDHWGQQPASYVAASPAQHYYLYYGSGKGTQQSQSSADDSSDSGEAKQTISYSYASPAAVSYAAPAPVVSYAAPVAVAAPAVQVAYTQHQVAPASHYYVARSEQKVVHRYGGDYGVKKTAINQDDDHQEAHRRAVEEHQQAHAEALRRLEEVRRSQKRGDSSESSEEAPKRAYGTPQVVSYSTYNGPQVTREETERLHAPAIAKQRELIARLDAINAQGPAKADPNYKEPSSSSSDDSSDSGEKTTYYYQQPAVHYAAPVAPAPVQEVTYQYYQQKPYTGPLVSRAETEYLHRDAIAKQQELIRQQAALIDGAKGSDSDDDSGESDETKSADQAQLLKDAHNEKALLARQEAEIKAQTLFAKQQGEYAKAAGPAEGAYRDDGSSSGEENSGHYGNKDTSSSNSGSQEKSYSFVPVYGAPVQVGYAYQPVAHTATYYQQQPQQVAYKYEGPQVTKEETEALHAEAIAKQRAIIAQHESFIARQRAALETRYSFQQAKDDSSESGESKKNTYASGYYTAAVPAANVHVVGPQVTNYVSTGYSPATFYAAPKPVTYVQPAAGVYAKDDSDSGEDQRREKAELSRQEAEVRAQIQLAKEQGAAAASEGASFKHHSSGAQVVSYAVHNKPTVVKSPAQYVYYRYARPTFGYYTPVVQKQSRVVVQAAPAPVPAATVTYVHQPVAASVSYHHQQTGGSSDDSKEW